jgi:hypothetical protein
MGWLFREIYDFSVSQMKKLLRLVTLCVLAGYFGLVVGEAFHAYFAKNHVEASCAICQVVHQAPILQSAPPLLSVPHLGSRSVLTVLVRPSQASAPLFRGRSPPVL